MIVNTSYMNVSCCDLSYSLLKAKLILLELLKKTNI